MSEEMDAKSLEVLRALVGHPQGLPAFRPKGDSSRSLFAARKPAGEKVLANLRAAGLVETSADGRYRLTKLGGDRLAARMDVAPLIADLAEGAKSLLDVLNRTRQDVQQYVALCEAILGRLKIGGVPPVLLTAIVSAVTEHQNGGNLHALSVPQLRAALTTKLGPLTIGLLHDALRELREAGQIVLSPWTGPLYQMPEPEFALLIGHEVLYYVHLADNRPLRDRAGGAEKQGESLSPTVCAQ